MPQAWSRSILSSRCPLCLSRSLAPTGRRLGETGDRPRSFPIGCESCGLLLEHERPRDLRERLVAALGAPAYRADTADAFGMDAFTLRIAATIRECVIRPRGPEQVHALASPHSEYVAEAQLVRCADAAAAAISLGYLCRPGELAMVVAAAREHLGWAQAIIILCDADAAPAFHTADARIRVAARRLAGDFSAQRNALQDLSASDWMLQLDADETLPPAAGPFLRALAAQADAQGVVSIGLARRNRVDGVVSDVYPDTQYRLNRRQTRYVGTVHERPDRPWQRSMFTLHAAIDHHLARAHVDTRSARYESMAPGQGRTQETALLPMPYRD